MNGPPESVGIRAARVDELPDVLNVLDGAMLETDTGRLRGAIDRGAVLVAVADGERVLGALVLDGEEVTAVAVRQRRRGQGVGTALVEAAASQRDRLVAEFDPRVRPFWEDLGFVIRPAAGPSAVGGADAFGPRRLRGVRGSTDDA